MQGETSFRRGRGRPPKHGRSVPHPRPEWAPKITLHQYRRGPDNPLFEATFLLRDPARGGDIKVGPVSLGTSEYAAALFESVAKFEARHSVLERGEAPPGGAKRKRSSRTFRQVAEEVVTALRERAGQARPQPLRHRLPERHRRSGRPAAHRRPDRLERRGSA